MSDDFCFETASVVTLVVVYFLGVTGFDLLVYALLIAGAQFARGLYRAYSHS